MGVLGEMFPDRKLRSEAGEAGSGQGWRLDLETGVIEVVPVGPDAAEPPTPAGPATPPVADPLDADVPRPAAPPSR